MTDLIARAPKPASEPARGAARVARRKGGDGQGSRHPLVKVVGFLLPSLALIAIFNYYPALRSFWGSLTAWNGFSPPTFIGIQNYTQYLRSNTLAIEWRNLAILFFGGLILYCTCPLLGAKAVVAIRHKKLQGFFKYIIVLPIVVPFVVIVNVWAFLLNPASGPVDALISALGGKGIDWLGSPHWAIVGILSIGFPWVSGLAFLIYLGGLQNIPSELREAAEVDRASPWRVFRSIELPLLIPQVRFVIIITGVLMIQNFIPILLLTNGGPGNATLVPGLDMYNSAFASSQYGYGMAIGTVLFVFLLIFTVAVLRFLRPRTMAAPVSRRRRAVT